MSFRNQLLVGFFFRAGHRCCPDVVSKHRTVKRPIALVCIHLEQRSWPTFLLTVALRLAFWAHFELLICVSGTSNNEVIISVQHETIFMAVKVGPRSLVSPDVGEPGDKLFVRGRKGKGNDALSGAHQGIVDSGRRNLILRASPCSGF